ncbi:MAG: FAD-binding protein [Candidatus Zixiibacteriota bacterium]|nr:MAG: FAD-binding protein [candidate division Zixibacteria bacterium]
MLEFDDLKKLLSDPDSLSTDLSDLGDYFHDATEYSAPPLAVLMARNRDDVTAAVKFCAERNIPITARGAGTGLSGGCVPSKGAMVLSTEHLRKLQIDPEAKTAICGPGVITKELTDTAEEHGLTYPPDPASYEESTLGGNVAENAGGLRCKRFGVTKDYVIGLEAVLADGSVLRTGTLGSGAGFSLGDLLIASEGTLAVITEIAVRLVSPSPPGTTILASFSSPRDAAQTVSDITTAGIIPTVMEFLDGDAAACSNEYEKTEGLSDAAAILLIETGDGELGVQASKIRDFCEKNSCRLLRIEPDHQKAEALWMVRRNLSKATKELARYWVSEDLAVPNSRFPELVDYVAQLNAESPVRLNSYGHAGDGNLHVNFLAPSDSPKIVAEIERVIDLLVDRALALNGTLSGEHGIGLAKKMYLDREFDRPTLAVMRKIKSVFDPQGILNPDKLLPDPE